MPPLAGTVSRLPNGVAGTIKTLRIMWQWMQPENQRTTAVHVAARNIISRVGVKDYAGEARALFRFVQRKIRYVREGAETLQIPEATLQLRAGDCDDMVILLGALLRSVGLQVALVVGGYAKDQYSHVWLRVMVNGRWVPMDPTEPHPMGWEPPLPAKAVFAT